MCSWRRSRLWDLLTSPRATARPRHCVFSLTGTARPRAGVIQVESIAVPRRQGAGGRRWHNPPSVSSHGGGKDSGETQALMNRNGLGKGAATWQRLCSAHRAWSGHGLGSQGGPEKETRGHGTLPVRPSGLPTSHATRYCSTGAFKGRSSPSGPGLCLFTGAKEPAGSAAGSFGHRHGKLFSLCPAPHFALQGFPRHLQHPCLAHHSSYLQPQGLTKIPPVPAEHMGIPHRFCLAGMSRPGCAFPARPEVMAAGTQQHSPNIQHRVRHDLLPLPGEGTSPIISLSLLGPAFLEKPLFLLLLHVPSYTR